MAGRLADIIGRAVSSGTAPRAFTAGFGAALGAVMAPAAATFTGDGKSDKDTTLRDMLAGAAGGAVGGMLMPSAGLGGGAAGGIAGGLLAGLFDKKSSVSGQDLRTPVMGGTKFPTGDSTQAASRKLNQSSAEVGPQPAPTYSGMGKMKKVKVARVGDVMDPLMDDPLIQYLKKTAARDTAKEPPSLTDLVDGPRLKTNIDEMPLGAEELERSSASPKPTPQMVEKVKSEVHSATDKLFDNSQAARRKLQEKDRPFEGFDQGVVDRVLGL